MEFASDYAYANNNEDDFDDEDNDEDDMASDLLSNISKPKMKRAAVPAKAAAATTITATTTPSSSSSSSTSIPAAPPAGASLSAALPTPSPIIAPLAARRRAAPRADTNVVAVKFGSLAKAADSLVAGDPIQCSGCRAVFSMTSTLLTTVPPPVVPTTAAAATASAASSPPGGAPTEEKKAAAPIVLADGQQLWRCEFCNTDNAVEIDAGEMPTTDSRDFQLEAAPELKGDAKSRAESGASSVIFCVDISGSMCSTTEVAGTFKLKGQRVEPTFNIPGYGRPPQQAPPKHTYVTRLQCVQASIDQQVEQWARDQPTKQVSLITFNHEVTLLGDGIIEPEVVTGDKLRNQKELVAIGNARAVERSVKECASALSTKLFALEETGQTALGPALCVAVSMAIKRGAGSRVVVCTDGKANVGLGSLDGLANDDERDNVRRWYEGIGNLAQLHGVIISVISIKGAEASLEDLGRVAEITGGTVDRVDPISLTKDFGSMLANPVIATHVSATFQLHRGLCFRNEDAETSKLTRDIGNVTEDSEITFEYQMKVGAAAEQFKSLTSLPFQLQISFTKLDGSKCMRVISKSQGVTTQREVAERGARVHLMAANVAQKSAAMADRGDYDGARRNNLKWGRVLNRSAQNDDQRESYGAWLNETEGFDRSLQQQQVSLDRRMAAKPSAAAAVPAAPAASSSSGGGFLSSLFGGRSSATPTPAAAVAKEARNMRDDSQYMEINKFKNKSSAAFARKKPAAAPPSSAGVPPSSTVTAPLAPSSASVTSAPPAKAAAAERKK